MNAGGQLYNLLQSWVQEVYDMQGKEILRDF